jgi:hypothetical protein
MRVICEHCGLPFTSLRAVAAGPVYCCTGCALAARVPVDAEGNYPVNAAALTATVLAFVGFNQALFWGVALLLAREVEDARALVNAGRFALASLLVGAGLWVSLAWIQAKVGARGAGDFAVAILSLLGVVGAAVAGAPGWALLANLGLALWALRGVRRGRGRAVERD